MGTNVLIVVMVLMSVTATVTKEQAMKELINIYVVLRYCDQTPVDLVTTDMVKAFELCAARCDRSVEIWLGDKMTQSVSYDEVMKVGWVGVQTQPDCNCGAPCDGDIVGLNVYCGNCRGHLRKNEPTVADDMTDFNQSLSEQEIMELYGNHD